MAERRSIGAAMEMTPEKKAFINGQPTPVVAPAPPAPSRASEKTIELAPSDNRSEGPREAASRPERKARRSALAPRSSSEVLDRLLVPITIRLSHRVAHALRRAHLEQRLNHAKPDTQQEIVEEAISAWLSKAGFPY